jgi:hypothetical protein
MKKKVCAITNRYNMSGNGSDMVKSDKDTDDEDEGDNDGGGDEESEATHGRY